MATLINAVNGAIRVTARLADALARAIVGPALWMRDIIEERTPFRGDWAVALAGALLGAVPGYLELGVRHFLSGIGISYVDPFEVLSLPGLSVMTRVGLWSIANAIIFVLVAKGWRRFALARW